MTAQPQSDPRIAEIRAWRLTLLMVAGLTILRLAALFATPLELYPDEAQYWLWSRELAFGYFSKPPMIAWLIWLTTTIGGDAEAWVRLSAPLALQLIPVTHPMTIKWAKQAKAWHPIYTLRWPSAALFSTSRA